MTNHFSFTGSVESVVPKSTKSGFQMTVIRVTQARMYQGKDKSETIEVTVFGENEYTNLTPGTKVMVSGRLSGRVNDYQGKQYFNMTLVANEIAVLDAVRQTKAEFTEEDLPF